MSRYHFSLGNSTEGPIGFCAAVQATTEREAATKLRRALRDISAAACEVALGNPNKDVEYVAVYFNPARIELSDIDQTESQLATE